MHALGNIVTDKKFEESPFYNIVKSYDEIDTSLPTLIISWKKAQEIFPNANILDWAINDNTYWCFGKRERNYRYQEDTIKFRKVVIDSVKKNIKYEFFNILLADVDEKKKFVNKIKEKLTNFYTANGMLYLYFDNEKKVYGISLRDIEYGGITSKKILAMVNKVGKKIIVDYSEIPFEIMSEIRNNVYLIPYICN